MQLDLYTTSVIPAKAGRLRDGTSIRKGGATGMRRRFDLIPNHRTSCAMVSQHNKGD